MELQPFAQHEKALVLRAQRNEVLSSNIANADTPNYKARDIDFRDALQSAQQGTSVSLKRTSDLHMNSSRSSELGANVKYRVPVQSTLDGNTVETDVEQAAFAENAVQYRASLAFLNGTIRTLKFAIRGSD